MIPLIGMVSIHAQTRLIVTPHLTALIRFVAPTPTIAPVSVCVVLTGIPSSIVKKSVKTQLKVSVAENTHGILRTGKEYKDEERRQEKEVVLMRK